MKTIKLRYKSTEHRDRAYQLLLQQGMSRWIKYEGSEEIAVTQPTASTLCIALQPTEAGNGLIGIAI